MDGCHREIRVDPSLFSLAYDSPIPFISRRRNLAGSFLYECPIPRLPPVLDFNTRSIQMS